MTTINTNAPIDLRQRGEQIMSDHDLATLGLEHVAYIRPVELDGEAAYSVHAADGTEIAVLSDRNVAFATIRQHDMYPVCVH